VRRPPIPMTPATRIMELRWLAQQAHPVWGGHIERGEPVSDGQLRAWIESGIVAEASEPGIPGYKITDKGRRLLAESR
jgi:hypothetical protein